MLLISAVRALFSFTSRCVSLLGALAALRTSVVIEEAPPAAEENRLVIWAPIDLLSKFAFVTSPVSEKLTDHFKFSKILALIGSVCARPNWSNGNALAGKGTNDCLLSRGAFRSRSP